MTIYCTSGAVSFSPLLYAGILGPRIVRFLTQRQCDTVAAAAAAAAPRAYGEHEPYDCGGSGRDAKRAATAIGGYRLGGAHDAFEQQAAARDRGAKPLRSVVAMTISARKKYDTYSSVSLPL